MADPQLPEPYCGKAGALPRSLTSVLRPREEKPQADQNEEAGNPCAPMLSWVVWVASVVYWGEGEGERRRSKGIIGVVCVCV